MTKISLSSLYLEATTNNVLECLDNGLKFDAETQQERLLLPDERRQLAERIARRVLSMVGRQLTESAENGSVT